MNRAVRITNLAADTAPPDRSPSHDPGADRRAGNLTDRIAERLIDEITGGGYRPGDVLPPEQEIAQRLGVSRTILREALSRLKSEGIVRSKQGHGLSVIVSTPRSVLRISATDEGDTAGMLGIVELRKGFEIEAAVFAAQRRDQQDLDAMRDALSRMAQAIATGDVKAGVDADLAFHRAIALATRNPHYQNFFDFLTVLLRRNLEVSRSRSANAAGRGAHAQQEHEKLFEAIESRDSNLARRRARIHVDNTETRLRSSTRPNRKGA